MRDRLFTAEHRAVTDFQFDADTAQVFDDMVHRSVPFYDEIQRMACELASGFASFGSRLYDYGCSTGTTLQALHAVMPVDMRFVGLDDSVDMLAKARQKLTAVADERALDLICSDIHHAPAPEDAAVVMMILTLQFVRPLQREQIIDSIHRGLNRGGCFVLVEKVLSPHSLLNRQFIAHYYAYKRAQGYSDVEIARKREALENVLIPYRLEENIALLRGAGFTVIDEFFRWYNFAGVVAVK